MHKHQDYDGAFPARGFLSGVLIGGLAGMVFALLNAPQSGRKTRLLIRQKGVELRDQTVEAVDEARQRADRAVRQARVRGRRVTRRVGARAREWQQLGSTLLEGQRERLQTTLEALQPAVRNSRG